MRTKPLFHLAALLLSTSRFAVAGATHYVDSNNDHPSSPFTSWATAAVAIQDAVDAATPGALILVTNGVYFTGGRTAGGASNRVVLYKPLEVRSVNGPQFTFINGLGNAHCVYLGTNTSLSGFTLTNGNYYGAWTDNATNSAVSNCVIARNYSGVAGPHNFGVPSPRLTVWNSTIRSNLSRGANSTRLNNCVVAGNSGGGTGDCDQNNCLITGNTASYGGGVFFGTMNNCTVVGNTATVEGGGVWSTNGELRNSIIYYNNAPSGSNWAGSGFRAGPAPKYFCCTAPGSYSESGNITNEPIFIDPASGDFRLQTNSPCIDAGNNAYAFGGVDLEGLPRIVNGRIDIGAYEYHDPRPVIVTQPADQTVPSGSTVTLSVTCHGSTPLSFEWRFNGTTLAGSASSTLILNNIQPTQQGDYLVVVTNLFGAVTSSIAHLTVIIPVVHYVDLNCVNPTPPYTSWGTAATNIQDAVDVSGIFDYVLVTNGIYNVGGRAVFGTMTNRVVVDRQINLRGVSGPQFTFIQGQQLPGTASGDGSMRCIYLASNALLSGFTLTGGGTKTNGDLTQEQCGGGAWCASTNEVISNCVMNANSAGFLGGGVFRGTAIRCLFTTNFAGGSASGSGGGGAYQGVLDNCLLLGNVARLAPVTFADGGGVFACRVYNSTIVGNSAGWGGGAANSKLTNSIIFFNSASYGQNFYYNGIGDEIDYCCTTPAPTYGIGNIISNPGLVNVAGGNFRLLSTSPCINSANNFYLQSPTDLEGNPRVNLGTVDMGAYEFQGQGSVISYAWLQKYGLPTDGSADYTDPDGDGRNNWQEWRCRTVPNNALSVLKMVSARRTNNDIVITWQSVAGVNYFIERSTNLAAVIPFAPLATNFPGQAVQQ